MQKIGKHNKNDTNNTINIKTYNKIECTNMFSLKQELINKLIKTSKREYVIIPSRCFEPHIFEDLTHIGAMLRRMGNNVTFMFREQKHDMEYSAPYNKTLCENNFYVDVMGHNTWCNIINLTEKKKTVLVEIKDTGKGIDEKDIKYIWDKYYHNEKKHKRNAFGTGLGLSIVKTILETHGYKYGVKSKLGEGTTFYFEISKSK